MKQISLRLLTLAAATAALKQGDEALASSSALLQEQVLRSDASVDGALIRHSEFVKFEQVPATQIACIPDLPLSFRQTGVLLFLGMGLVFSILALMLRGCFIPAPATECAAQRQSRRQLEVLNGMRPLLLTYVFFVHFPEGLPSLAFQLVHPGWPMQFFFVLSGFVRRYSMEGKGQFSLRSSLRWIALRTLPLLPMYYLGITLDYFRLVYFGDDVNGGDNSSYPHAAWVMSPLFLQSLFPVHFCGKPTDQPIWNYAHFMANGVGWFTASLVWANCCFPALYNLLDRRVRSLHETVAVLAVLVGCRAAVECLHPEWGMWGNGIIHLYAFAPLRILEYASGVLASHAVEQLSPKARHALGAPGVFDFTLVFSMTSVIYIILHHLRWIECTGDFFLVPLWCFFCITAQLGQEQQEEEEKCEQKGRGCSGQSVLGGLQRLVSCWFLKELAPCGFAFYMIHQVGMRLLGHFHAPAFLLTFGGNFIGAWLMGVTVHHAYEKHASRTLQSLLSPPRACTANKEAPTGSV
eukprot:gb/GFBE01049580.1/.p1 GENE.gb/GFBE01049580.1/~~gb/GFBE01049580.1/.p1  ORF type:complete len:522 (+),score=83.81 gb/GFBE01049580.1/:1-1566(+)